MFKETRRVVSGMDSSGNSKIISDEKIKAFIPYDIFPSFQIQNLFYTEDKVPSVQTRHLEKPYQIDLPEGALRFMKIRMPMKTEMMADLINANQPVPDDWTKYNLHCTDSIDYIYVLSGAITCVVGEELIDLKEGDFLSQISAEHTWINDHAEPCYLICVMVGAIPSQNKMTVE